MNYAKIRKFDVSNGPSVRSTLFVSGCTNGCEGCFNKELQDFNHGSPWTLEVEENFIKDLKNINIKGVNILGGEPLDQTRDKCLYNLLNRIKKEVNKPIWLWSGYTFEDIKKDNKKMEMVALVDILIDGRFEIKNRDISLKYRGSKNQRVIKVKETLENNSIELLDV
ncbi:anaerobic ribonucleoside-triphosphate reductase activating protein [Clostridium sp.]|uniref:anaerobic ribonucleoside-triphosphate reductase activating protein n=1 Tax=Clostridium sp. TaxID=1506 RepID=UPI00262517F7|nr:anaerobic ribonucleoside-triphosphate reductase activating protein [Clostridium sp.]